jgi:hypothetical protein
VKTRTIPAAAIATREKTTHACRGHAGGDIERLPHALGAARAEVLSRHRRHRDPSATTGMKHAWMMRIPMPKPACALAPKGRLTT